MPYMIVKNDNGACVHKQNEDGSAGESLHCYTGADAEAQCKDYMKALYANEKKSMSMMESIMSFLGLKSLAHEPKLYESIWAFTFTELASEADAFHFIDGMAASEDSFTSMSGAEVTIRADDLQSYIANTQAIIESTKTAKGEVVGLPIDKNGHDHAGGAGWIVGLELDKARNVIKFAVKWTQEGIDLIKGNIRRFFSPSIDPVNKTILGGSLTNWPATRNEKGQLLLRPIELSQSIKEIDMDKTLLEILAELPGKVAEAVSGKKDATPTTNTPPAPVDLSNVTNPSLESLVQDPAQVEEMEEKVQELVRQRINLEMRKDHTKRFVAELVGGTQTKPYGFAVKSKDLIAWMLSLSDAQAKFAEKLLTDMRDKSIDFAVHGLSGDGFIQQPPLAGRVLELARTWVKAGKPIKEFFDVNPEIGRMEDFNLAEFTAAKE